jgi:hypothetical protein
MWLLPDRAAFLLNRCAAHFPQGAVLRPDELWKTPSLPTANDVLFSSEGGWDNACVNFAPNAWLGYALGYKEAGDRLVEQLKEKRRRQDMLVYPIVFLYRHYLEIMIKDVIRQAQILLDDPVDVPQTHTLDQLWLKCSALLERVSPGDSVEEQRQIGRLLGEFMALDPFATAFRYPVDRQGNRSLPGIRHIDLQNVQEVIGKVSVILEGASAQIDHYQDCGAL